MFTNEQMEFFYGNFRDVHKKLEEIFMTIAETKVEWISFGDVYRTVRVSEYIGNKCIAAVQLLGLIEVTEQGNEKRCKITVDGQMMKELILSKKK